MRYVRSRQTTANRRPLAVFGFDLTDLPVVKQAKGLGEGVADVVTSGCSLVPGCAGVLSDVSKTVEDVVRWWWQTFRYTNIFFGPQLWFAETAGKTTEAILNGQAVGPALRTTLSEQGKAYARQLQKAAPYVAMVPGIGTGLAVAMTAAAGIALGQPVGEMAVDGVADQVPGGPALQEAFRIGARLGAAMLQGKTFDEAAASAARKALVDEYGDEAGVAFDAGFALARGKSLQDAGFQALYYFTKGTDLASRAAYFADAVAQAARQGRSVGDVLASGLTKDVAALGGSFTTYGHQIEDVARKIAAASTAKLPAQPDYLSRSAEDVAVQYGVVAPVARAAMAAITWTDAPGPSGTRLPMPVVDEGTLDNVDPVRKNLRPTVQVALRNLTLLRPNIDQVRIPPWLAQKGGGVPDAMPQARAPKSAPPSLVANVVAPLALTAPLWAPAIIGYLSSVVGRR